MMRYVRYLWRFPLLLLHMLMAIPSALVVRSAWAAQRTCRGERLDLYVVRWWARTMLRIIGIRSCRIGMPLADPVMFVANHVSWLDIVSLHSQRAVCFVAKAEIERWPLIGWMASHAGTIFHRRGNTESMTRVAERMGERLRAGRAVAVFPEGSTGAMDRVRTFHARILQAAVEAGVSVQPVALRYSRKGQPCTGVAFRRGESFVANALRVLGEAPMDAEVHFLEPIDNHGQGRKAMAAEARQQVARALGLDEDA